MLDLHLSTGQKQTLSQRMQVSVKILQMNSFDLQQYAYECALENPLIELEIPREADSLDVERLRKMEWLNAIGHNSTYRHTPEPENDGYEIPLYEKRAADSLTDVLLAQLPEFRLQAKAEQRVRYLIYNLDENGYITGSHEQLQRELSITGAQLDETLKVLHRMEPAGVGAAGLKECLLIQAQRIQDPSPILHTLIEKHLDTLAKNQIKKLAKALHVPIEDIKEARSQLLSLNPKPGNGYSSYKEIPYIRPDVFVVRFENRLQIIFNDYDLPKIELNQTYFELIKNEDPETANYIKEKRSQAEWLISCIQQRKNTMLACINRIVYRQPRFFEQGPGHLVPMTLADIANDLGLHPSTISRAIRGKYLQCQWGIFGIANLFSHTVSQTSKDGETHQSRDTVLMQIKCIIDSEEAANPKSDQEIAAELQKHNIAVARRTVAKYREKLGIPAMSRRKTV